MRRLALLLAAAGAALLLVAPAAAHPLGNFTVNRYANLDLAGGVVYLHYALDVAEIPTYQLESTVRAKGFVKTVADQLDLRVDGRRAKLVPLTTRIREQPGAGGLHTLRLDVVYAAGPGGKRLEFADRLYPDRIGWREIVVTAREGAQVVSTTAATSSVSDELRAYPSDGLTSPLDVRSATISADPGSGTPAPPALDGVAPAEHRGGGFEALVGTGELSFGVVLVSLLVAAFWGAAHALTPGHGKALVAGYLVGTRGRPRDAVLLGATVTVTHTAGVFALGLVTLALSQFIVPEQLYPWLTLVSGLLVVAVGLAVLRQRLRSGGWSHGHAHGDHGGHTHSHHGHDHEHHEHHEHHEQDTSHAGQAHDGHDHGHHHGHEHHHAHGKGHAHHDHAHDDEKLSRRGILGVGIAAGLLPCPSALVVLLGAIALHRIGFGFALIVAFSLGLAATITAIGLVAVMARRAFSRVRLDGPVVRALPALSALVILGVGVALTVRAIPAVV